MQLLTIAQFTGLFENGVKLTQARRKAIAEIANSARQHGKNKPIRWIPAVVDCLRANDVEVADDVVFIRRLGSILRGTASDKHYHWLMFWLYLCRDESEHFQKGLDDASKAAWGCTFEKRLTEIGRRIRAVDQSDILPEQAGQSPSNAKLLASSTYASKIRLGVERLGEPISPQPFLTDVPASEIPSHYSHRLLEELIGHVQPLKLLERFLFDHSSDDCQFRWFQIAGTAGQGKSRLAADLVRLAREKDWSAGFLMDHHLRAFLPVAKDWVPANSHLVVIDYVVGHLESVKQLLLSLTARDYPNGTQVRLLLVERQRWDRGGIATSNRGSELVYRPQERAGWYLDIAERTDGNDPDLVEARYSDGVIELKGLSEQQLLEVVRKVFAKLAPASATLPSEDLISEQLDKIDGSGRPLYAYLLAQAYAEGVMRPAWSRGELLRWIVDNDQERRWRAAFDDQLPVRGDDQDPAMFLALLATIVGDVDCRQFSFDHLSSVPANVRRQALALTNTEHGRIERGENQTVSKLEPDLLGEWFVLDAIECGANVERLLHDAWALKPQKTAEFLLHAIQDFASHPSTKRIAEFVPTEQQARQLYRSSTPSFVAAFLSAGARPPKTMMAELEAAAQAGSVYAMDRLALCLCNGRGIRTDQKAAVQWWTEAGSKEHRFADANLGVCFHFGLGCERDPEEAVRRYRAAADEFGWAKANLAICYRHGDGVKENPTEAVRLLREAVEMRDAWAATNLGRCYADGYGLPQSDEKAIEYYRLAVSSGDGRGMAHLGECYEFEKGVVKNLDTAIRLYRDGADAFDGRALANLARCYQNGTGVPKRSWKAVGLCARGAHVGDGLAFRMLGRFFEEGFVVRVDRERALHFYRRAIDYHDEEAEKLLSRLEGRVAKKG